MSRTQHPGSGCCVRKQMFRFIEVTFFQKVSLRHVCTSLAAVYLLNSKRSPIFASLKRPLCQAK